MTLTLKPPTFTKLDPKKHGELVRQYVAARAAKREAEKAAREADQVARQLQTQLESAMQGADTALCGTAMLSWHDTRPAAATLTLRDGATVIAWDNVTSVLVGNVTIARDNIAKIYGGRDGSHTLKVEGQP